MGRRRSGNAGFRPCHTPEASFRIRAWAGLALNGGVGWLRNKYGLTCDNLVSAEVVTADGTALTANAGENSDLFWALRGGGGNFGVVTSFEFALYPVGPMVAAVFSMYPMAEARKVLKQWREWVASAPEEAATEIVTSTPPRGARIAGSGLRSGGRDRRGSVCGRFAGRLAGSAAAPAIRRTARRNRRGHSVPGRAKRFRCLSSQHRRSHRLLEVAIPGRPHRVRGLLRSSPQLRGESQFGLDDGLRTAPWRRCTARKARRDSFPARDAAFVMNFMGDWRDPRETPRHVAWVREAWNRLTPAGTGKVYLNYLGREERDGDALVRSAFGSNYDRLVGIKTKYDPTNLFRLNQNIKPALTPA